MSLFSFDIHKNSPLGGVECVYVAVGAKGQTSMDALTWTLKKAVADRSNTIVFLVHVFPEIRFVPSALGNLPISGANEQLAQTARSQERGKRSRRLQKYRNICISFKVRVDTILVENDMVAETILDLIPHLNITNLVVGIAKSNLRRLKSNKGNGIADQLLQKAPETCEVKIICEGKEVILEQIEMESRSSSLRNMLLPPLQVNPNKPGSMEMESRSSSLRSMLLPPWLVNPDKPGSMEMESRSSSLRSMLLPPWLVNPDKPKPMKKRKQWVDYFSCSCFKPKAD
ncbi:hypothetical protein EUGRSUZ_E03842 [Eucalyptus grandis]|uniref:Uncharacterized protein n=2 Tax=Eucalyptus grandis TaxID=71139 RepID=A0ACC3L1T9_EUCGR|nr:hypothetical protein EUGRSUZ_E03842 [Eucalyptus grandis]